MTRVRAAVVGGGIIGVAVARQLTGVVDSIELTVFEKEDRLAMHQTGHNSGVVHARLYYKPGSLKATLCRRGAGLLGEFAAEKGIVYDECGKLVVAQDVAELERLKGIFATAKANDVPGVRLLDFDEIHEVEPSVRGVAGLHSPHTAITDYVGLTEALAVDIRDAGGQIVLGTEVISVQRTGREAQVVTKDFAETFDLVITCAGLQSDRLSVRSGAAPFPKIIPFLGDYFLLNPSQGDLVRGLIYPVPDPRYPFLGVHLTKRVDGETMVGPNAFLSLDRESYHRQRFSWRDVRDTAAFSGFWRFAAGNLRAATTESKTALSKRSFVNEARKYIPGIELGDLTRGPRGIRAQAMNSDGSLVDDFVIVGDNRIVHVRNAPSPGATSSMAIAEYVVNEALTRSGIISDPPIDVADDRWS